MNTTLDKYYFFKVLQVAVYLFAITILIEPYHGYAGTRDLKSYTSNLPFTMPEMKEPSFPDVRINITEFGAKGDGQMLVTDAINKAIEKCSKQGGGTVVVPAGTWLTGSIKLESNVNLHLDRGALVQFSKRFEDFPIVAGYDGKSKRYLLSPPLFAYRAQNIAITGEGVMDGAGEAWRYLKKDKMTSQQWKEYTESGGVVSPDGKEWWPSKEAMEGSEYLKGIEKSGKELTADDYAKAKEFLRPDLVRLVQCNGILLDGPTFENSPKFHVHLVQSENIIVRNINIRTEWWAQNGDGLDLSACRNVVVYGINVDVGDDGICVKPANISSKQKEGPACENIVIADCIVHHAHGGFVIGSESVGGGRNISVKNCVFAGTDIGLRFKSLRGKGGVVENIFVDSIQMRGIADEAIRFDMYYNDSSPDRFIRDKGATKTIEPVNDKTPRFQNFSFKNIVCLGADRAILMNGLPEMPIRNMSLENVWISSNTGILCLDADSITMKNVTITPANGPVISLGQSQHFVFDTITFPKSASTVLSVDGEKTSDIQVLNTDRALLKDKIIFGSDVKKETVIIK